MVEKKCETTFKLDILIPYHALQILLIKKIIFFLQPLLPPFQHCLFSPETLWPFPVFLWYCICTSISLFPVSHLILKTNKQTIKKQRISKKKNDACMPCGQKTVTWLFSNIFATVLIWDSPNSFRKAFYLHNFTLFSFYLL